MEMVVVLAIIAILAAIITPMITSYVDRARVNAARNDVRNIAAAIISFNTDTRAWPIYVTSGDIPSGDAYDVLVTDGDDAALNPSLTSTLWTTSSSGDLRAIVNENSLGLTTSGRRAWNGGYMNDIAQDPWGTKYYFNGVHLKPGATSASFLLSAGPDKTIDTEFDQTASGAFTLGHDDIVQRIPMTGKGPPRSFLPSLSFSSSPVVFFTRLGRNTPGYGTTGRFAWRGPSAGTG